MASRRRRLDDLDLGLIEALRREPRRTNRSLARELGCSVTTVAARIRRLSERRVLRVLGTSSIRALGYELYTLLWIQVQGRPVEKVAADLANLPEMISVASTFGAYEIIATLISRDRHHLLDQITTQIPSIRGVSAVRSDICLDVLLYRAELAVLHDPQEASRNAEFICDSFVDADGLDRRIVSFLQVDGRMGNSAIARELGVSEGTIRYRLRRLEEQGLLELRAITHPAVRGVRTLAYIGLDVDPERINTVASTLAEVEELPFVAITMGRHDIFATALARDSRELARIIEERVKGLAGVRRAETTEILTAFKHTYLLNVRSQDEKRSRDGV